jgi:hypothetical protein
MIGWTPDGAKVELSPRQEAEVRALTASSGRGRASGWSTVLHTALRYDNFSDRGVPIDDPAYAVLARAGQPYAELQRENGRLRELLGRADPRTFHGKEAAGERT